VSVKRRVRVGLVLVSAAATLICSLAIVWRAGGGQQLAGRAKGWLAHRIAELRSPVPLVRLLVSYRNAWNRGVDWSPADVVDLLRAHPDAYLALGDFAGYSLGSPLLNELGHRVDSWQRAISDYDRKHGATLNPGHICIDWRPDLVFKHVDGSQGEESCGSLLGLDQCAPTPCSEHAGNPCARWHGDMEKDWGPAGRFDPAWLARVPASLWQRLADEYYGGEDFCSGSDNHWGDMTDRRSICRQNSETAKVVPYGKIDPATRRIGFVSGVALDLRKPEAREWNARFLMSKLKNLGIDPGEGGCVVMGYKPGLWSFYDGPDRGHACPAPEANSWSGFETPENASYCWGGAFVPTPYGPGEFEHAMNEQMRTVFRLLDAPAPASLQVPGSAGRETYSQVRFITTERPETRGTIWWIWDRDIVESGKLIGEMREEPTQLVKVGGSAGR